MIYKKPLLEVLSFDVDDIITTSSAAPEPPEETPVEDPILQVPSGGNMGAFEDFEETDTPTPTFYKAF